MQPDALEPVDTVLDSALFHVFAPAERAAYAEALTRLVRPGGRVVVLALAVEGGSGYGPEVTEDAVPGAFTAPAWSVASQERSTYRGRIVVPEQAEHFGVPVGGHVDLPAWLAVVHRLH